MKPKKYLLVKDQRLFRRVSLAFSEFFSRGFTMKPKLYLVEKDLVDKFKKTVEAPVGGSVLNSAWTSIFNSVYDSVRDSVKFSVRTSIFNSVSNSVWRPVRKSL